MDLANVDVPDVGDKLFEKQFDEKLDKNCCTRCYKPFFRRIRKKMVASYIEQLKNQDDAKVIMILNTMRKSIFENLDQIAHLTLLEKVYYAGVDPKNYDQNSYKVAFPVISVAFFSTYLI